jgi:hypothetical protein
MDNFAYLTAAQAGALVDRIGLGESGKAPFGAPNRSGATVDIMEGDSVLTREARDCFVLRTPWHEYVPGHSYGRSWEELETLDRGEVVRRFTYVRVPRDLIATISGGADWRSLEWASVVGAI